eukprot:2482069-Rhodomonas_salina.1
MHLPRVIGWRACRQKEVTTSNCRPASCSLPVPLTLSAPQSPEPLQACAACVRDTASPDLCITLAECWTAESKTTSLGLRTVCTRKAGVGV